MYPCWLGMIWGCSLITLIPTSLIKWKLCYQNKEKFTPFLPFVWEVGLKWPRKVMFYCQQWQHEKEMSISLKDSWCHLLQTLYLSIYMLLRNKAYTKIHWTQFSNFHHFISINKRSHPQYSLTWVLGTCKLWLEFISFRLSTSPKEPFCFSSRSHTKLFLCVGNVCKHKPLFRLHEVS